MGSHWPRGPLLPAPPAGIRCASPGPVTAALRGGGPRAPSRMGQDMTAGLCTSILNISFLSEANRAFPYLNANFLVKNPPLLTRD